MSLPSNICHNGVILCVGCRYPPPFHVTLEAPAVPARNPELPGSGGEKGEPIISPGFRVGAAGTVRWSVPIPSLKLRRRL